MITRRIFVTALSALFIAGCATGYRSQDTLLPGISGGYSESQGPGELVHVVFNGNGYTAKDKVGLYLMYRCAELAQKEGKPYFSMYASITHAIADRPLLESVVTNVANKPTSSVYILFEDGAAPNRLATAEILEKYGPEVTAGRTP